MELQLFAMQAPICEFPQREDSDVTLNWAKHEDQQGGIENVEFVVFEGIGSDEDVVIGLMGVDEMTAVLEVTFALFTGALDVPLGMMTVTVLDETTAVLDVAFALFTGALDVPVGIMTVTVLDEVVIGPSVLDDVDTTEGDGEPVVRELDVTLALFTGVPEDAGAEEVVRVPFVMGKGTLQYSPSQPS